jgi:hypothetical protein
MPRIQTCHQTQGQAHQNHRLGHACQSASLDPPLHLGRDEIHRRLQTTHKNLDFTLLEVTIES